MRNALHLIDFIKLNPEMFKGEPSAGNEEEFKKFKDAMDKDPYSPIDKSINPNYICRLLEERFKEIRDRHNFDYLINKFKELENYKEISAANALHLIDYINSNAWILNVPNIFLANGDDDEYKKLKKMMDENPKTPIPQSINPLNIARLLKERIKEIKPFSEEQKRNLIYNYNCCLVNSDKHWDLLVNLFQLLNKVKGVSYEPLSEQFCKALFGYLPTGGINAIQEYIEGSMHLKR